MERAESVQRAKNLRKNATPQERKLWYAFLCRHPLHFRRQHPVGPYILDFYCHAAHIAVEVDGGGHYEPEQAAYDKKRDAYLQRAGITVVRFTNLEIDNMFAAVCEEIDRQIAACYGV